MRLCGVVVPCQGVKTWWSSRRPTTSGPPFRRRWSKHDRRPGAASSWTPWSSAACLTSGLTRLPSSTGSHRPGAGGVSFEDCYGAALQGRPCRLGKASQAPARASGRPTDRTATRRQNGAHLRPTAGRLRPGRACPRGHTARWRPLDRCCRHPSCLPLVTHNGVFEGALAPAHHRYRALSYCQLRGHSLCVGFLTYGSDIPSFCTDPRLSFVGRTKCSRWMFSPNQSAARARPPA